MNTHGQELKQIVANIEDLKGENTLLVAIDGGGGAGKSTFAKKLGSLLSNTKIVQVDDFYKSKAERVTITDNVPVHLNFDRERLRQQILEPLKDGLGAHYRKYDWDNDLISSETEDIPAGMIVIVEGLGTLGDELSPYFDYKIWLDVSRETRRKRGIERDTEEWADIWDNEYLPQDERYIKEQKPQNAADFVVKI